MKRKKSMLQSNQFYLTTNKEVLDWILDHHCLWLLLRWKLCLTSHSGAAPSTNLECGPHPPVRPVPCFLRTKCWGQAGLQPQFEQMYQWHLQAGGTGRLQISTGCLCSWRSPGWSTLLGGGRAARWRIPVVENGVKCHFLKVTLLPNADGPMPACSSID